MTGTTLPLVTAVITTHNRLDLLQRAVQSVLAQTYPAMELVVVDDASTDDTAAWCESQPFRFIHSPPEESRGGNHARNVGIEVARGEYVAFLDDDDRWLPEKIQKQVEVAQATGCELVHCGRREETVTRRGTTYRDKVPEPFRYGDVSKNVLLRISASTSTLLVKREALYAVGLFDEELRFWQEYELLIRLAQRTEFGCALEPLCVYRIDTQDGARLTNKYFEWRKTVDYIHEKHADLYATLGSRDRFGVRVMVWSDACKRCYTSALYFRFFIYGCLYVFGNAVLKVWPA